MLCCQEAKPQRLTGGSKLEDTPVFRSAPTYLALQLLNSVYMSMLKLSSAPSACSSWKVALSYTRQDLSGLRVI